MKIIGHRGAKGLAPENTIEAFKVALRHKVAEIEFDVRITKDGIPILAHDPFVHNAVGDTLEVRDHTYEELEQFQPNICRLDDSLDYINAKAVVIIEIKPGEPVGPIISTIKRSLDIGVYTAQDILIASYDYDILKAVRRGLPECQVIVNEDWSGVRVSWRARRLGTKRIAMNARWLWKGFIVPVAHRGWQLTAFTINDVDKAKRWEKYGLYAIYTDFPDRFQK